MVQFSCLEGEQPIVKWVYPNEGQDSRVANEYLLEGIEEYAEFYLRIKPHPAFREFGANYYAYNGFLDSRIYTAPSGKNYPIVKADKPGANLMVESSPGWGGSNDFASIPSGYYAVNTTKVIYSEGYIVQHQKTRVLSVVQTQENVTLLIKNNGELIYSRTASIAPTVTTECVAFQQCPPNTCEVICSDTICCYNSNGIAVESFTKT